MGVGPSDRQTLAALGIVVIAVWFIFAGYLALYIVGNGFNYGEDQAQLRLHAGHVALVWAGVLLGMAVVGFVLGCVGRSSAIAVLCTCVAVISLIAVVILGTDYSSLQREEQRLTHTYAPGPTSTHCQAYSGGSNDCPGG